MFRTKWRILRSAHAIQLKTLWILTYAQNNLRRHWSGCVDAHWILLEMLCPGSVIPLAISHQIQFSRLWPDVCLITKTRLYKYNATFTTINWKFLDTNSDIFHISAQNIDCGWSLEPPCRGGSNEDPQFMFLSRNKGNNVYPCKPLFYYIKVEFKGVKVV